MSDIYKIKHSEHGKFPRIRERSMSGFRTSAKFPKARVKDLKINLSRNL